ncbi:hypothetical protein N1I81_22685 [Bacillus sp. FSL M8-0052]|uniref:hypothetical protein n=1 Tax=Bacillus sp. FSL M8-0052 TaxID=2978203 RepID=UPI0030F99348
MLNLVNNYFLIFMIAAPALFALSFYTRIKKAKTKKDKRIFTIYSVLTGALTVLLLMYKFL